MATDVRKEELVLRLLEAKQNAGKSFNQIAQEMGVTNLYAAQLFHRQAPLCRAQAQRLQMAVPTLSDELIRAMEAIPLRSLAPGIIQDPTIYRFREVIVHYSETLRAIIQEEFGNRVMLEGDFKCDLQKIQGKYGEDRVLLTMVGSFEPDGIVPTPQFQIEEATVEDIQEALKAGTLTSKQLVEFYIARITRLNPQLKAVIEVSPDALELANEADTYRKQHGAESCKGLRGIPILLKDNIATKDKLQTTAGSLALVDSIVPRDAGVVKKLRDAGAIIFGKANLSEWMYFRSTEAPHGWSPRGGQTMNPYDPVQTTFGSSSGSAVGVSANMATVTLGTETDGSIINPASFAAVVGIKPTVGLTSRAGVIPLSHNMDSVGPICRTMKDAVEVLDVIVGVDDLDSATTAAAAYIPRGGYKQFLKRDGLRGKRLGVLAGEYFVIKDISGDMEKLFSLAIARGAVIVKDLELPNAEEIVSTKNEDLVLQIDFKHDLQKYLSELTTSKVRSLEDVIRFNEEHTDQKLDRFGQDVFIEAQARQEDQQSQAYKDALARNKFLTENGIDYLLQTHDLHALVAPTAVSAISLTAAIAGYPAISIPAGYAPPTGFPFGICFLGNKGSEGVLIEIAYALEQASNIRHPPPL
ncbi:probable amidase At4g34880 [Selaginella moellendorffii]|nr:probable amidase At4g34880 [Selaginella moellendorffii]|eukprot:XP_002984896.2 probable amidase At4g34880 [Selaginella moellendorffii]